MGRTDKKSKPGNGIAVTAVGRTAAADARAYEALRIRRRSDERKNTGFEAMRAKAATDDLDLDRDTAKSRQMPPPPHALAARLLLAAAIDSAPGLADAVIKRSPIAVVVDVPDSAVLVSLQSWWADVVAPGVPVMASRNLSGITPPNGLVELFVHDIPKPARKADNDQAVAQALQFGVPTVAFSPESRSHLPEIFVAAADYRLAVGGLNPDVVRAVVETVTGRACRVAIDEAICAGLRPLDLTAAVRPGLPPSDCVLRLRRIADSRIRQRDPRDLRLDDIHGADDAVAWARSAISDVQAWRRSEQGWSSVDRACLLVGPPGTFKTSMAAVVAQELKMPLVVGSFAKWQAAGHMGDFLAAMAKDFNEIRRTKGILMIDELDSFVVRGSGGSSDGHERTYMAACVNGLLEKTDGLASMEGVLLLAATNHVNRIDPALLRAGRFSRVIHIGLPDVGALSKILRVRLDTDLPDTDLRPFAAQAAGMTGADIGRVVEDARRFARREGVSMAAAHLWRALGDDDIPAGLLRRVAAHEAGHLLAEVALQGPDGVTAVVTRRLAAPGRVVRRDLRRDDVGTLPYYFDRIRIDLAGRAAEEILTGSVSDGAGSTDPASDLSRATAAAIHVVSTSGIAGPRPLLVLPENRMFPDRDVVAAADALMSEAAESVRTLLLANRTALEAIAGRLERDGALDGEEAEAILCGHGRVDGPQEKRIRRRTGSSLAPKTDDRA